ncbi:MAG TPA: SRPBCC family protein [Thermoleophilaceae bacterium]|nr:SRPBCC family protein [Thermoleophilaceae bacterium]
MRAAAEIVIERPVEAVWEWAADPRHWHRWLDGVRDVSVAGDLREGSRFSSAYDYGGRSYEVEYELLERRRPRRQVVRSVAGPFPFEGTLELSEDVGGTRVRQTVTAGADHVLTRFVLVVARPLVRRSMRRRIAGQLERLKTMVELEAAL